MVAIRWGELRNSYPRLWFAKGTLKWRRAARVFSESLGAMAILSVAQETLFSDPNRG